MMPRPAARGATARGLRHRITIQRATVTRGASGQEIKTWSDFATLSAGVVNQVGRESVQSNVVVDSQALIFRTRYFPGITVSMRVKWGDRDRYYDIIAVHNIEERNKEMHLVCQQGVSTLGT